MKAFGVKSGRAPHQVSKADTDAADEMTNVPCRLAQRKRRAARHHEVCRS